MYRAAAGIAAAGSIGLALAVGRYKLHVAGVNMAMPEASLPMAVGSNCDSTDSCAASLAGVTSAHCLPALTMSATSASGTGMAAVAAGAAAGAGAVVPDGRAR